MRHRKEHHEKMSHHKGMAKHHHHLAKTHMKIAEHHEKEAATKRALGIHTEGERVKVRDRHEARATEHGIREKRKYERRK